MSFALSGGSLGAILPAFAFARGDSEAAARFAGVARFEPTRVERVGVLRFMRSASHGSLWPLLQSADVLAPVRCRDV